MKSLLKFAAVGAVGTVVNIALLWLFTDVFGIFYLASAAIAIEVSIITNFIMNDLWTFSDKRSGSLLRRGVTFNFISLVAMVVNVAVLFALTEYIGLYYIISELVGIAAGFLLNFILNVKWNYKDL